MFQRDKPINLKVLALVVAGFWLLVVDVALVTLVVVPSLGSTRAVPTRLAAAAPQDQEIALIVPTHDPRTPWPTKTPAPTATPWLIVTPTPEPSATRALPAGPAVHPEGAVPPAGLLPAENSLLPESAPARAAPQPEESAGLPESAGAEGPVLPPAEASSPSFETIPSPTLHPAGTGPIPPPSGGDLPAGAPEPSETPFDAPGETPGGDPTATPDPTQTPLPPGSPLELGDLPDFETYLRLHRNAIAGQPLAIGSLNVDYTNDGRPLFLLGVVGSETGNAVAAQPAADLLDYGRDLLDDAKRYLGGVQCGIAVVSSYATSTTDACSGTPAWCQVGTYDQATNKWSVTWTYVRGSFTGGPDTLEAWNTGQ